MFKVRSIILAAFCFVTLWLPAKAANSLLKPDDPDLPEDYVIASILQTNPGGALYSKVGHIAIRMQCPTYKLDYVFTYEAESASKKVLKFLAGKLTGGLVAINYEEYFSTYKKEGRGVTEYLLNIPLKQKQNLWRILDNHMLEGTDLPYDYLKRSCTIGTVHLLKEGLDTLTIDWGSWPEQFQLTRREISRRQVKQYAWTTLFLELVCNDPIDSSCPKEEKILMPADFIEVMGNATINGEPLMGEGKCILEPTTELKASKITPLHVAILLLIMTIICAIRRKEWMSYVLLAIQSIIGAISTYLIFFSTLCCTQWSWLLVPFNLLPLIFWKWRRYWRIPFGIVCLIWAITICLLPHLITDWTYVVLAFALAVSYLFNIFVSR